MSELVRPILDLPAGRSKVLMHSCCAPCSGEVMEAMTASGIDYAIYFYNPNIHPVKEYEIRKQENIRFAEKHGIEFIDSSGLRVLVEAHQRAAAGGRSLVIHRPSVAVKRLLEISGLSEHLTVTE